jgi:hypothetical protein
MAEGINVLAVMSNDFHRDPDDSPVNMEKFAAHFGFNFPYLVDEDHAVGRAYGAVCTPDFFGFNKDGGLQYRGRLDDAKMGNDAGRVPELLNAMRQIAAKGRGPQEQVSAMGCSIKWRQIAGGFRTKFRITLSVMPVATQSNHLKLNNYT